MEEISKKDLENYFKQFDKDNSGSIDKEELGLLLKELKINLEDEVLEAFIQSVDEDGSGKIEFAEFEQLVMGD